MRVRAATNEIFLRKSRRATTNEILWRKRRRSQKENRVHPVENYDILSVTSSLILGCDIIMMPITRFLFANCKIGNVDELCLRKLKNSETLMEVGSVHVDRVNHFYDFTCEGVIQILPSCHWFLFQWLTFHHDAVLSSIAEEQTRLDNSVLGLLSNVEWFVAEPNVFSPG
ncbi:hypothetical protein T05_8421 [Trichinella murrelli]|uniref:Uncharacterized protein n=1 Tax=Trichinella murrelli TaxID=144512 RepID=A0A0V0T3P4_9BILA|nr:hypothetical protein T05_8421 [Trichinella murrelli]